MGRVDVVALAVVAGGAAAVVAVGAVVLVGVRDGHPASWAVALGACWPRHGAADGSQ